jgi:hypothetical protein
LVDAEEDLLRDLLAAMSVAEHLGTKAHDRLLISTDERFQGLPKFPRCDRA